MYLGAVVEPGGRCAAPRILHHWAQPRHRRTVPLGLSCSPRSSGSNYDPLCRGPSAGGRLDKSFLKAVAFPIGAGSIYGLTYLAFNNWIWKFRTISRLFGLPNLEGKWVCMGNTVGGLHTGSWDGELTISQTWDKIRVYLVTTNSKSKSVSASIIKEPGIGYILMYSYKNDVDIAAGDLHSHVGYCEIALDDKLEFGRGEYFNSKGRVSFGVMEIRRKVK